MDTAFVSIAASFTGPESIGTGAGSMLWMLPLLVVISVVYKTLKLNDLTWKALIKSSAELFAMLVACVVSIAVVLLVVVWLITR